MVSNRETIHTLLVYGGPACSINSGNSGMAGNAYSPGKNWNYAFGYKRILSSNIGFGTFFEYGNYQRSDRNFDGGITGHVVSSTLYKFFLRSEKRWSWGTRFKTSKPNSVYPFLGVGLATGTVQSALTMINGNEKYCSFIIPFGLGYTYQLSPDFNLGFEIGAQYLAANTEGYKAIPGTGKNNEFISGTSVVLSYRIL